MAEALITRRGSNTDTTIAAGSINLSRVTEDTISVLDIGFTPARVDIFTVERAAKNSSIKNVCGLSWTASEWKMKYFTTGNSEEQHSSMSSTDSKFFTITTTDTGFTIELGSGYGFAVKKYRYVAYKDAS